MPANTLYFAYLAHNGIISDNQIQKKPAVLKLKKLTAANNTADVMSYGILIDADFDNMTGIQGADYSISINWNRSSNTWYKSFEELESANKFFNVGDR